MKKLLKNGICGSVNSARIYYSQWKSQQMQAKKKNAENENTNAQTLKPNRYTATC